MALWSALTLIPLCAQATEFGGVVDVSSGPGFDALCQQLHTAGKLTWLRTSSASLAREGFNQVAVAGLPSSPREQPRVRTLSPDLLAVYWECRTNLPVFPNVQQAWEVDNEPDFFFVEDNPDRVAAVIKAAYWGIKAGNPRSQVLLPSLAFVPDKYPRELAANGVYPFSDGYNFHYYGWAQDFLPSLKLHRQFLTRQHWNLPIWVTEAGHFGMRQERSSEPEDLARQQTFHERLAITAFAAGVDYYMPFILTPFLAEGNDLGLVTSSFVVRPALESYLFLSRHLHGSRMVYQIWHRPTQSEIGVVLAEPDGDWLTALWTPYRWNELKLPAHDPGDEKDLLSPSLSSAGSGGEGARRAGEEAPGHGTEFETDSTVLELEFRFPPETPWVAIGLRGDLKLTNLPTANFEVSAGRNLFLRTPPHRFDIKDCEWIQIGSGASSPLSVVSSQLQGGDETTNGGEPDRRKSTQAGHTREGSIAAGDARETTKPPPSPVVLQLVYDPFTIAADKPSQTYRFNPRLPVLAHLEIYNFSASPQTGRWWPDLPAGWRIKPSGTERGELAGSSRHPVSTPESSGVIPPLGKVSIPIQLIPPDTLERERSAAESHGPPDFDFVHASRPRTQPPPLPACGHPLFRCQRRRGTGSGGALRHQVHGDSRARIAFHWAGEDDSTDVCMNWLEADGATLPPNVRFSTRGWQSAPQRPDQWAMSFPDQDTVRLTLLHPVPSGENPSALLPIPDGVELGESDVLRLELRLRPSHRGAYYRLNLITPGKEVFRYTEDQPLGNYWTALSWRLGDFGGTFWSHVGSDCRVPVKQFRYVRLSVQGLAPGDAIEIRNVGICQ